MNFFFPKIAECDKIFLEISLYLDISPDEQKNNDLVSKLKNINQRKGNNKQLLKVKFKKLNKPDFENIKKWFDKYKDKLNKQVIFVSPRYFIWAYNKFELVCWRGGEYFNKFFLR